MKAAIHRNHSVFRFYISSHCIKSPFLGALSPLPSFSPFLPSFLASSPSSFLPSFLSCQWVSYKISKMKRPKGVLICPHHNEDITSKDLHNFGVVCIASSHKSVSRQEIFAQLHYIIIPREGSKISTIWISIMTNCLFSWLSQMKVITIS